MTWWTVLLAGIGGLIVLVLAGLLLKRRARLVDLMPAVWEIMRGSPKDAQTMLIRHRESEYVVELYRAAIEDAGDVTVVVFPETACDSHEFERVQQVLAARGIAYRIRRVMPEAPRLLMVRGDRDVTLVCRTIFSIFMDALHLPYTARTPVYNPFVFPEKDEWIRNLVRLACSEDAALEPETAPAGTGGPDVSPRRAAVVEQPEAVLAGGAPTAADTPGAPAEIRAGGFVLVPRRRRAGGEESCRGTEEQPAGGQEQGGPGSGMSLIAAETAPETDPALDPGQVLAGSWNPSGNDPDPNARRDIPFLEWFLLTVIVLFLSIPIGGFFGRLWEEGFFDDVLIVRLFLRKPHHPPQTAEERARVAERGTRKGHVFGPIVGILIVLNLYFYYRRISGKEPPPP